MLPKMRQVAHEIRGAGAGGNHSHPGEGVNDALLFRGKFRADAQGLPVLAVHPRWIEGCQDAGFAAALSHLGQKLQPGFAQIVITDPGNLHRADREHPFGAVYCSQCRQNLHGFLDSPPALSCQHGLFFFAESHQNTLILFPGSGEIHPGIYESLQFHLGKRGFLEGLSAGSERLGQVKTDFGGQMAARLSAGVQAGTDLAR